MPAFVLRAGWWGSLVIVAVLLVLQVCLVCLGCLRSCRSCRRLRVEQLSEGGVLGNQQSDLVLKIAQPVPTTSKARSSSRGGSAACGVYRGGLFCGSFCGSFVVQGRGRVAVM